MVALLEAVNNCLKPTSLGNCLDAPLKSCLPGALAPSPSEAAAAPSGQSPTERRHAEFYAKLRKALDELGKAELGQPERVQETTRSECAPSDGDVDADVADEAADGYDVITARALAPLPKLLAMSENLLKTSGQLLFLKGRGADAELTESEKTWRMTASKTPSVSDPEGVLLLLTDIERRHG